MNPLLIGPLLELGKGLIDRMLPDKTAQARERADAERALRQLALEAEGRIAEALGKSDANQTEVNKIEAASASIFKGGWRPFIGWVCGFALAYQFIARPLLGWATLLIASGGIVPPPLDMSDLLSILAGMLGLGYLRTSEKKSGVA
jgi:hypothetical protein